MTNAWQRTELGHHIDLLTGFPFKSSEYSEDENAIRLLRGDNVIQGAIRWEGVKRWVNISDSKIQRYKLRAGDFVIAMDRTWVKAGLKASLVTDADVPSFLVQRVARLRAKNSLVTNFLPMLIRGHKFEQYIKGVQTETAVPHISPQQIKDFPILLPPLPEQKAIADLLATWDEAIEKTERLIQAKERRFKWLLRELISDPRNRQTVTGWRYVLLGDVCKVTKGKQLNVEHMKDGGEYYALNGGIEPSGRTDDWNTEADTITISEGGNSCGYVNYNTERFWSGGHCYSLKKLKSDIDSHYLYFYLKMNEPKLMSLRVGSGLPNIQKKDVDKFVVALPPLSEQLQIAEVLSSAQEEIDLLKRLAEQYKTQKRGLMQKMLTGEWRVKLDVVKRYA